MPTQSYERQRPLRLSRGFTLIELMIVVTIVAILAMLGVVGYRKLVLGAHTSEATHMVQAIKVAEELYHSENQAYVGTASLSAITGGLFPVANASPSTTLSPWDFTGVSGTCTTATPSNACWQLLPVHADGPVQYGYATAAGLAGTSPGSIQLTSPSVTLSGPSGKPAVDWYWVVAEGNPAGYPASAGENYSWVVGNSFTQELYVTDQ